MKRVFILLVGVMLLVGCFLPCYAYISPSAAQMVQFWTWGSDGLYWQTSGTTPQTSPYFMTPDDLNVGNRFGLPEGMSGSMPSGTNYIRIYNHNPKPNQTSGGNYAVGGIVQFYDRDGVILREVPITAIEVNYGGGAIERLTTDHTEASTNWASSADTVNYVDIFFDMPMAVYSFTSITIQRILVLQGNDVIDPEIQWSQYQAEMFLPLTEGQEQAYQYGLDRGKLLGNDNIYREGYDAGYDRGFEDGSGVSTTNNWLTWLGSVLSGVMNFEIMPGFTFGGILATLIGIGLMFAFLRYFAGG